MAVDHSLPVRCVYCEAKAPPIRRGSFDPLGVLLLLGGASAPLWLAVWARDWAGFWAGLVLGPVAIGLAFVFRRKRSYCTNCGRRLKR